MLILELRYALYNDLAMVEILLFGETISTIYYRGFEKSEPFEVNDCFSKLNIIPSEWRITAGKLWFEWSNGDEVFIESDALYPIVTLHRNSKLVGNETVALIFCGDIVNAVSYRNFKRQEVADMDTARESVPLEVEISDIYLSHKGMQYTASINDTGIPPFRATIPW
jgi:hypothetical protein